MLFAQDRCCGIVLAKVQQKLRQLGLVKEPLVTFSMRGADLLSLCPAVPFAGGGDGSAMGGETDEECGIAIFFARQLTDVQLTAPTHFRCPGIAQMRIVRPDDAFGWSKPILILHQRADRFGHVLIAQVP